MNLNRKNLKELCDNTFNLAGFILLPILTGIGMTLFFTIGIIKECHSLPILDALYEYLLLGISIPFVWILPALFIFMFYKDLTQKIKSSILKIWGEEK
ncbi:MAG: hypothetical protein NTX00_00700 [Candidatus Parcubacteria bacterium]|nr:hypothetical protein [Candidatus Parcubacteria bacterium]